MNEDKEPEFVELDKELYENMIERMRIMVKFLRKAAKLGNQEILERGWLFCGQLKEVKPEILEKIGSNKEELMSLTVEIFEKLEVKLVIITKVEDKNAGTKKKIYPNNPEFS